MTSQKHEKISFPAEKREVVGKKVSTLRDAGKLPGNIFGRDFPSTAVSVDTREFMKVFKKVGETQVLYLDLDKKEIPVIVSNIHIHSVSGNPLHVDFKKIDLKVKIEADVPVKLIGESDAVLQHKGDLLTVVDTITVEALPSDMPQEIEVDISVLKEVDDEITVSQLKASPGFVFISEPTTVVAKIAEHKEESIEPDTTSETATEEAAEGAEGATEEGETAPTEESAESPEAAA